MHWLPPHSSWCGCSQTTATSMTHPLQVGSPPGFYPGQRCAPCSQHGRQHRGVIHCRVSPPTLPWPHGGAQSGLRGGGADSSTFPPRRHMGRRCRRGVLPPLWHTPQNSRPASRSGNRGLWHEHQSPPPLIAHGRRDASREAHQWRGSRTCSPDQMVDMTCPFPCMSLRAQWHRPFCLGPYYGTSSQLR